MNNNRIGDLISQKERVFEDVRSKLKENVDNSFIKRLKIRPVREAENEKDIAAIIDHTILKPEATVEDVKRVAREAIKYRFATVCVNSSYIELASDVLQNSEVLPISVVGFPLGAMDYVSKSYEAVAAVRKGAMEIDTVINVGRLKSNDFEYVLKDIFAVVEAVKPIPVKVIIETCLLTDEEKETASLLCVEAGAAFVKTSTGFSTGGAKEDDIKLIRKVVGEKCKIKASGGIKTLSDLKKMVEAGADRIGSSQSVKIVEELKNLV
ncbi:MAG: deoxyribose-phosphate aldolase [Deltaproteobacteria bacterium]|nr:deoxyribose-phosphate aldolase [Deltaproteobacteria bacterium]